MNSPNPSSLLTSSHCLCKSNINKGFVELWRTLLLIVLGHSKSIFHRCESRLLSNVNVYMCIVRCAGVNIKIYSHSIGAKWFRRLRMPFFGRILLCTGNHIGYEVMRWHVLNSMAENAVWAPKNVRMLIWWQKWVDSIVQCSEIPRCLSLTNRFICMTLCYFMDWKEVGGWTPSPSPPLR